MKSEREIIFWFMDKYQYYEDGTQFEAILDKEDILEILTEYNKQENIAFNADSLNDIPLNPEFAYGISIYGYIRRKLENK